MTLSLSALIQRVRAQSRNGVFTLKHQREELARLAPQLADAAERLQADNAGLTRLWNGTAARVAELEGQIEQMRGIVQQIASMKWCEEDDGECEGDSGPYCTVHGDNFMHVDLIRKCRSLAAPSRPDAEK